MITASIARTSASYAARGSNTATLARCWRIYLSIWLCLTIGKKAGIACPAKVSVLHSSFTHKAGF